MQIYNDVALMAFVDRLSIRAEEFGLPDSALGMPYRRTGTHGKNAIIETYFAQRFGQLTFCFDALGRLHLDYVGIRGDVVLPHSLVILPGEATSERLETIVRGIIERQIDAVLVEESTSLR